MAENRGKSSFLWRAVKSLMLRNRFSRQDIVLKSGNEEEVDLTLLLMTKGANRSLRLVKSS